MSEPALLQPTDLRSITLQAQEWNVIFTLLGLVQPLIARMVAQVQAPAPPSDNDDAPS
jgi:hypothetical protein